MNKTLLIFKHEFITTLKRVGFIVMTLLLPALVLLAIGVSQLISGITKPPPVQVTTVGYVDEAGGFTQYTTLGNIKFDAYNTEDVAKQALFKADIKEYFVIPVNYSSTGVINRYTLEKQIDAPPEVSTAIKVFLTNNLLAGKVAAPTMLVIESPLNLVTTRLTNTGTVAPDQGGLGNLIVPGVFALFLVLSITFTSSYLLQGLGEEKENRLIEVLLSSVSTGQLLTGKVLGLGAAGLVQVSVWLAALPLLLKLTTSTFGGFFTTVHIPPNFIVLGVLYFILGYALFAVVAAASGAMSPSAREGQQLSSIFSVIAISPLWYASAIIAFPDNPLWVALTIFPLTAPTVTLLRMGLTDIPLWEIAASATVLILSIIGLLWVAVRIFRTYLLTFGKRPGWGEVIRTLRNG